MMVTKLAQISMTISLFSAGCESASTDSQSQTSLPIKVDTPNEEDLNEQSFQAVSTEVVKQAYVAGDCQRCHEVPDMPPVTREDSCKDCHLWLQEVSSDPVKREVAMEYFPLWTRYEKNLQSYFQVPSLEAAMARLDPQWVKAYLQNPKDIRPSMSETMPRFQLTEAQVDAIAYVFQQANHHVSAVPAPRPENVALGAKLFADKNCQACHSFGGLWQNTLDDSAAPDLAHTRDRMSADRVVAWILNPQSFSDKATMPALGLEFSEALAIRDYLFLADLQWPSQPALGDDPVAVHRPVSYGEVEEKVFAKICVHCHMDPTANDGRAGPGNAGGFGWPASGVELETYEGVVAVADRLADVLLTRRREAHRDVVQPGFAPAEITRPKRPGMPLGLPPIPDEDISLVLAWIEQGMPK